MANGLTKALSVVKYKDFVRMTRIEDQRDGLAFIKKEDNLRDAFQQHGADYSKAFGFRTNMS